MDIVFLGVNDIGMRLYDWLCERKGVDVLAMLTERDQLEVVHREQPDILVSVGFDYLVPSETLEVPAKGAINLHPSLLPYNRGKNPNVWPIVEDTPSGVTLHYMDDEFDTGDIIAQKEVETDFSDTGKDLHQRLEEAQFELFTEVWPEVEEESIDPTPQSSTEGTYHETADFVEICEIDPDEEFRAKDLLDRLRALTFPPFDNAYVEVDGKRYYIEVDIFEERDGTEASGLLSSY